MELTSNQRELMHRAQFGRIRIYGKQVQTAKALQRRGLAKLEHAFGARYMIILTPKGYKVIRDAQATG